MKRRVANILGLFVVLGLYALPVSLSAQTTYTVEVKVAAANDDYSVYRSGASWIGINSTQSVGYEVSNYYRAGFGMRFLGVEVPSNATITNAYIQYKALYSLAGNTVNSRFCGEKQLNPTAFTTLADYQARRGTDVDGADNTKRTSTEVDWDSIAAVTANQNYQSPNIALVLQEIISIGGWDESTQDVVLFHDDHADRSAHVDYATRYFYCYNEFPANAPLLHIEYTLPVPPPSNIYNLASTITFAFAAIIIMSVLGMGLASGMDVPTVIIAGIISILGLAGLSAIISTLDVLR